MSEGGYSLEKYRKAEEAGKLDITPEELKFLKAYRTASSEMFQDHFQFAGTPMVHLVMVLMDMIRSPERRSVILDKKRAKRLEKEYSETVEGQMEMAQSEANRMNDELEWKKMKIRMAVREYENYLGTLNERTLQRRPESKDPIATSDTHVVEQLVHAAVNIFRKLDDEPSLSSHDRRVLGQAIEYVKFGLLPQIDARLLTAGSLNEIGGPIGYLKREMKKRIEEEGETLDDPESINKI